MGCRGVAAKEVVAGGEAMRLIWIAPSGSRGSGAATRAVSAAAWTTVMTTGMAATRCFRLAVVLFSIIRAPAAAMAAKTRTRMCGPRRHRIRTRSGRHFAGGPAAAAAAVDVAAMKGEEEEEGGEEEEGAGSGHHRQVAGVAQISPLGPAAVVGVVVAAAAAADEGA